MATTAGTGHRTRRRTAASVVLAAVASAAFAGCSDHERAGRSSQPVAAAPAITVAGPADARPSAETATPALAPSPAATPEAAVMAFAAAEAARDDERSYGLLAAADRAEAGSAAGWRAAHKTMPRLRSAAVERVELDGAARATVWGPATFETRLDRVVGLVPSTADATWVVVAEDGGWRVAYGESTFRGRFPTTDRPDEVAGVRRAVEVWVDARRRCETTATAEPAAGLLGATGLADRLCRREAASTPSTVIGSVGALAGPAGAPVVAAYGPEAERWARVVAVAAPVPMRVVTAPFDDGWVVVAVLPAEPAGAR